MNQDDYNGTAHRSHTEKLKRVLTGIVTEVLQVLHRSAEVFVLPELLFTFCHVKHHRSHFSSLDLDQHKVIDYFVININRHFTR